MPPAADGAPFNLNFGESFNFSAATPKQNRRHFCLHRKNVVQVGFGFSWEKLFDRCQVVVVVVAVVVVAVVVVAVDLVVVVVDLVVDNLDGVVDRQLFEWKPEKRDRSGPDRKHLRFRNCKRACL